MRAHRTRSLRSVVGVGFVGIVGIVGVTACGGGGSEASSTTLKPLTSTAYVTTPPLVSSTVDPSNTVPPERQYTVQSGDYLYAIAEAFGVKAEDIASYNSWTDGVRHPLNPGDVVKIPAGGTPPTTDPTTESAAPSSDSTPSTPTTVPPDSQGTYTVEEGDFLYGIAEKFGTTAEAIATANGWTDGVTHNIFPGDVIVIPAKSE